MIFEDFAFKEAPQYPLFFLADLLLSVVYQLELKLLNEGLSYGKEVEIKLGSKKHKNRSV